VQQFYVIHIDDVFMTVNVGKQKKCKTSAKARQTIKYIADIMRSLTAILLSLLNIKCPFRAEALEDEGKIKFYYQLMIEHTFFFSFEIRSQLKFVLLYNAPSYTNIPFYLIEDLDINVELSIQALCSQTRKTKNDLRECPNLPHYQLA
jgi:hypothetical protein